MAYAYSTRRYAGRKPGAPARKIGTWKLAYADFLTALCAFFLVMWIVHGVSSEDKAELARQFGANALQTDISAQPEINRSVMQLVEQLKDDPRLKSHGTSVNISVEPGFIRIDLTDMATRPLFASGHGGLNTTGTDLTRAVGHAISLVELPIVIEGHTDSNPSLIPGYSNWEISADRANSARRILEESGVKTARIRGVTGLADTRPLLPESSALPANRRISIVLLLNDKDA